MIPNPDTRHNFLQDRLVRHLNMQQALTT
jgi:hypothetical protein